MSKLTEKYLVQGQAAKLVELSEALAKQDVPSTTIHQGSPEWSTWRAWRKRNGLGTAFMDSRGKYSVPCDLPPVGSLDTALMEAQAATSRPRTRLIGEQREVGG